MFTENVNPPEVRPRRGRPPGRTVQGRETRALLFETAIKLMAKRGYAATTLRDVAAEAGVSPTLLYRYFPSKQSVVLALYDELSARYAAAAAQMPRGRWRDRFVFALRTSLDVLEPHRKALSALVPVLVGDAEHGLFSPSTTFSRLRVQQAFQQAVVGATDAPRGELAGALGRLLYLLHLTVVLWWLLDKSRSQRATRGLVALIARTLPSAVLALRFPPVVRLLRTGDALFAEALLGDTITAAD
jgi:AcrR family transcriptional regulator